MKCDACEKSGMVYPVCACKNMHAACFKEGICPLCKEEYYIPSYLDLFYIFIIITVALGSIVIQHI